MPNPLRRLPTPVERHSIGRAARAGRLVGLVTVAVTSVATGLVVTSSGPAAAAVAPASPAASTASVGGGTPSSVRTIPLTVRSAQQRTASATATQSVADSGIRETAPFSMVGVSWARGSANNVSFSVRVRSNGHWSGWSDLKSSDLAPDAGGRDDRASDRSTTDPLWVGRSNAVQVRLSSASQRPASARIELVDPGTSPTDAATAAAPGAGARTATGASALAARPPGVPPTIISRAGWGADESLRGYNPGCSTPQYGTTVKMGFVHHSDGTNNYSTADSAAIVRSIYVYHVKSNHWCDVGYNFLVDRFGRIFEGRYGGTNRPVLGAHTGGFNTDSFAATMMGTFTTDTPPSAMLNAMADLYAWKLGSYYRNPTGTTVLTAGEFSGSRYKAGTNVTFNTISGHRDADFTTCPGDRAYALLPTFRSMVASRMPASPIGARWNQLGGAASSLGQPTSGETTSAGGLMTQFQGGSITWSSATGARMLDVPFTAAYLSAGGPGGSLGFPTVRDESPTAGNTGRYAQFQHGWIHSSAATGAHETHGSIADRFAAIGFESSPLGFPQINVTLRPDRIGSYSRFQGGYIFSTPALGAHEVYGAILTRWRALNYEAGLLGYPTSNPGSTTDGIGQVQRFQQGDIFYSPGSGPHEVRGAIRDRYASLGSEQGTLGYPTTDERTVAPGVVETDFEHGSIRWTSATGGTAVLIAPPTAPAPPVNVTG